jgi:L-glyceraldehyde 3-phosphate reductase
LTPKKLDQIAQLNALALKRGQTLAEMALAWDLAHPEVTSVLIGASKPAQILDNLKALQNTSFSADELKEIDDIALK